MALAAPVAAQDPVCGNSKKENGEACDGTLSELAAQRCDESLDVPKIPNAPPCEAARLYLLRHYCDANTCKVKTYCGNGKIDESHGEECDGHLGLIDFKKTYCSSRCQIRNFCGNGVVNADRGEGCDGGAGIFSPGEFCTNTCQKRKSQCGNNVREANEACDSKADVIFTGQSGLLTQCKACRETPLCGNGRIDTKHGERCDGELIPQSWRGTNQYCSATCEPVTAVCGNGLLEGRETCDLPDGTPVPGGKAICKGCQKEATCGNHVWDRELGEVCDSSAPIPPSQLPSLPCTKTCLRPEPLIVPQSLPDCAAGRAGFFRDICNADLPEATGCKMSPKLCRSLNLDCGETSESILMRACYSHDSQNHALGICHEGIQTLNQGNWESCKQQSLPWADKPEPCDGLDNNCDGSIDEGCACEKGERRRCGTSVGECRQGWQTCLGSHFSVCEDAVLPATEICDKKDNDCDGLIDLGFSS